MRTMWRMNWTALIAFISLGFTLPSLGMLVAEEESKLEGLIEIDYPYAGEAKVEINLAGTLFALAAKVVRGEEGLPEASEFLANLKAVKVRIYDQAALGDKEFGEVLKFYEEQLKKEKWDMLARVKEEDSRVGVYLLTSGDIVSGLTVLVGEPEEVVIVNLAGKIDTAKLSQIHKITGVDFLELSEPLRFVKKSPEGLQQLKLKKVLRMLGPMQLPPEKEKKQKELRAQAIKELFWEDKPERALPLLKELEEEGLTDRADYVLMGMIYYLNGAEEKTRHYVNKAYVGDLPTPPPPSTERSGR